MAEYRLYYLDTEHHIRDVLPFETVSDEVAVEIAQRRSKGRPIELWNRDRLVLRRIGRLTERMG